MANEAENNIYQRLITSTSMPVYHPALVSIFAPDWTMEPGDVVTVHSGEETYDVPVFSLNLQWNGGTKADIQSTGNQEREPLPALRRKEYANRAYAYGAYGKAAELETVVDGHSTNITQNRQYIELIASYEDLENAEIQDTTLFHMTSNQISQVVYQSGTVTAVFNPEQTY